MRISNYPTDTLTGDELILATDVDTSTQKYKTVNFSVDTLKTFLTSGNEFTNIELGGSIIFEGATANNFETTLSVTDPTADRTVTLQDASGTIALTSDITLSTLSITASLQELNYMDGVTSGVQAQLNSKIDGSGTTGRIPKFNDSNTLTDSRIFESSSGTFYTGSSGNNFYPLTIQAKGGVSTHVFEGNNTSDYSNFQITPGQLSKPGINFGKRDGGGDSNTGIYSSAADNIELVTGGTTGLSINSSQKVTLPGKLNKAVESAPASATAAGTAGDIIIANDAIYVCITTGTAGNAAWKKAALSTF